MTVFEYTLTMLRRAAEHDYSWSVSPAEAHALVEEVERLRAERHIDNEQLARAWDESRDMERAAVLAWLRSQVSQTAGDDDYAYDHAADAIERGEHRKEEKP
jgi:O-acetylhomoserine/O-acetylserine sulfhydrylase-like pyridoxal-dependent enzyme